MNEKWKKRLRILLWITLVLILVFLALTEWVRYTVYSAGKSAKEFCDAAKPGSESRRAYRGVSQWVFF